MDKEQIELIDELVAACELGSKLGEAMLKITGYVSKYDLDVKQAKKQIDQAIIRAKDILKKEKGSREEYQCH